jgi:AcrR family transcriptional regulator
MPATKNEIAIKFMDLAFRFGLKRTAVEDVARELHISKKTIYEHFASKDELLHHGIELWAQGQRARVESRMTETTALGRIQEVVGFALADARAFYAGPHVDIDVAPEITAQVNDKVFAPMVRELLAEGSAAGEFEVPDCEAMALFVVAMGTEAVRMIEADPECSAEESLMEAIRRLLPGVEETT